MLESELVNEIAIYLNKHKIRSAKEIRMGIGVPDIAINLGASKAIIQISDYYLLALAEYIDKNKKTTVCDASTYLSFDKNKTQQYINQLLTDGIVAQKGNIVYKIKKIFGLNLGKTISIEAKIKDWKSGILQAQRYLTFSDYSYLALPESKIHNVDLHTLQETGIGLLSVSEKRMEEIAPPKLSSECNYKQKYILTSSIIKNSKHIDKRKPDAIFSKL